MFVPRLNNGIINRLTIFQTTQILFAIFLLFFRTHTKKMSTPCKRRLLRDFKKMKNDPPSGVSGAPFDDDIMKWNCIIFGYASSILNVI